MLRGSAGALVGVGREGEARLGSCGGSAGGTGDRDAVGAGGFAGASAVAFATACTATNGWCMGGLGDLVTLAIWNPG